MKKLSIILNILLHVYGSTFNLCMAEDQAILPTTTEPSELPPEPTAAAEPIAIEPAKLLPENFEQVVLSFSSVVKKTAPAVVSIIAVKMSEQQQTSFANDPFFAFFLKKNQSDAISKNQSLGSGVIVDTEGFIITCAHVLEHAKEIRVKLSDCREFSAEVVLIDKLNDLAAIRLKFDKEKPSLPFIPLSTPPTTEVGDLVLAIGNPFGLGQTVTHGILSALARFVQGQTLLQTDAPINPGNSGGALTNLKGELIGIPNVILSKSGASQGVGFAIPAAAIFPVLEAAKTGTKIQRTWDGVYVQPLTQNLAESLGIPHPQGVIVAEIHPQSPTIKAGLKTGDIITAINKNPILCREEYVLQMRHLRIHQSFEIEILRQGKKETLFSQMIAPPEIPAADIITMEGNHIFSKTTVGNLSPALAIEQNFDPRQQGVIILDVTDAFMAQQIGLKKNDIIDALNNQPIDSVEKLKNVLTTVSLPMSLTLRRGHQLITINIE